MNKELIKEVLQYISNYCKNEVTCRECNIYKTICNKIPCLWNLDELNYRLEEREE